jgi:WhiB family transcriptional regulator, redox-sensing transcriptional regulator
MESHMAIHDLEWLAAGSCRDLPADFFFPHDGVGVEAAQRICANCPVKDPCLEYALTNRISQGVWGGASERQRRKLNRQRKARDLSSA